jgi:hypothetical protein
LFAALLLVAGCSPAAQAPTATPSPTATRPVATAVPVPTLTATELKALLSGNDRPLVYDARSRDEHTTGHVPGAQPFPLDELEANIASVPRDRLVVIYCHGGT